MIRFGIIPWKLDNIRDFDDLCNKIVNLKKRPTIPEKDYDNISIYLINIMKSCWEDDINKRPNIDQIYDSMEKKLNDIE